MQTGRKGFPVVIRKLGLQEPTNFLKKCSSFKDADLFLGRFLGYTSSQFKNKRLILRSKDGEYWIITTVQGVQLIVKEQLHEFYIHKYFKGHVDDLPMPEPKLTFKEKRKRDKKIGNLLRIIDTKYGGINDKAQGKPEFKELQRLVGVDIFRIWILIRILDG